MLLSLGILFTQLQYFYPSTFCNKINKEVVLTFDDGPDSKLTPQVIEILEKYGISALFFTVGDSCIKHPDLVKQLLEQGHLIGNHTQNHKLFFAMLSRKKIAQEIDEFSETLTSITQTSTTLFRPPVGYMNPSIAAVLKQKKLKLISWNLRSFDTLLSEKKLLKRLVKKTKPSSIVLMHDNLPQTAQILETYIQTCLSNGIIFANKTSLLEIIPCDQ